MQGFRLRLVVHALDRTGPPMLAQSFACWLADAHPEVDVTIVSFRGGPLEASLSQRWPVHVVLREAEAWNPNCPPPARFNELADQLQRLPPVDVHLLISVAGGQVLPLIGPQLGPIVTWSVELGEDLHWVDATDVGLATRTDRWLAGSRATATELVERCAPAGSVTVVPEFVEPGAPAAPTEVARFRREAGATVDQPLVLGAGIATYRKGLDLFLEAAVAHLRGGGHARFAWIGGEQDVLHPLVAAELDEPECDHVRLLPSRAELGAALAAADVFLHTARLDAFPLVCLQAAMAGTPVVAFEGVGGRDEMFGPTAVGAPYPDLTAMVDVMRSLEDHERRTAAGSAQRRWVSSRFTTATAAPVLFNEIRAALEAETA